MLCIKRLLGRLTSKPLRSGARISSVSVQSQPAPLANTGSSFDIRIGFKVSAASAERGLSLPAYVDALGFVSGPAEVGLTTTRAQQPPSPALEHRLLSLLYGRATATGSADWPT